MEAECSFSAIVKQQAVAGGDKPEEKNAVQLLISMNSKQRQEERWRRERKSYVTRRCPSSLRLYTNVLFITSTMAPECESWMLFMEIVVPRLSQGGDEEENERK